MYNHQLDTFIRTAELGSFGKAAESLYISSTAVIQQIKLLENTCGFKLFNRTNHGVKLTPAGRSLYEDARTIIRFSEEAVSKAKLLAESSEYTLRIGTSLLYKCRSLADLWPKAAEQMPDLKIEIVPMPEYGPRKSVFDALGRNFDMFEGIYASAWEGICQFTELSRTSVCCAVSPAHKYANKKTLSMSDLDGECLVMPVSGVSDELDAFRSEVLSRSQDTSIIDSTYYGMDTFAMCELNPYILITQPVYSDIHSNLVTIPLDTDYSVPYGLIYANEPTSAVKKFLSAIS